ncbi:MAG: ABC transporter ATP-binding protein [Oscillospiraceae bacterium]
MRDAIVKTQNLKKYYQVGNQVVKALDGVDFAVREREFVAIIGKSGSGKSTLLHMIGGLDTPTEGSVVVDGIRLEELNADQLALYRRRKVGFIFQQYNLIPDLNVYDNIVFPLELDGAKVDTEFIDELLKNLNIADKAEMLPSMLSGGEQQRVALVRALAARPAIILADEPTGNLDTAGSHDVIGLLQVLARQYQQTVIVITHDPDIAQMAERIVRIEDGRILSSSPADEMVEKKVYGRSSDGEGR